MKITKRLIKQMIRESVMENLSGEGYVSGMNPNSARPAGSKIFDATVMIYGNHLMLETPKGHVELMLTPEQVSQLKSEWGNLAEESQSDPYNAQKDTYYPDQPAQSMTTQVPVPEPPPMTEMAVEKVDMVSNRDRKMIGKAFEQFGVTGNKRDFESPGQGLSAITHALSTLGYNLDMVSGGLNPDKGRMTLPYRRSNDEGQDAFDEKPLIKNSRISVNWENLSNPGQPARYEIMAYPG
jgi:hypothetical protein